MKVCFIDDNPRMTCRAIEGIMAHYKEQKGEELGCTMILVNMDGEMVAEQTITYYQGILGEMNVAMKVCLNVAEVQASIQEIEEEDPIFMLDLCMNEKEVKDLTVDSDYKAVSMEIMEILDAKHLTYFWYSGKSEENYKDPWQRRFRKLYGQERKIPKIYERNDLVPACFKKAVAKEILGV